MGRYLERTEGRSELQRRIAADLRSKALAKMKQESENDSTFEGPSNNIEDTEYLKGTKKTTSLASVWLFVFVISVIVFGLFIYKVMS